MSLNARHAYRHPVRRPRELRQARRLTPGQLASMLRDIQVQPRDADGRKSS